MSGHPLYKSTCHLLQIYSWWYRMLQHGDHGWNNTSPSDVQPPEETPNKPIPPKPAPDYALWGLAQPKKAIVQRSMPPDYDHPVSIGWITCLSIRAKSQSLTITNPTDHSLSTMTWGEIMQHIHYFILPPIPKLRAVGSSKVYGHDELNHSISHKSNGY